MASSLTTLRQHPVWQHRSLLGVLALFYFAQGLPSGLMAKALPALARDAGMSLPHIGLLSLAALPWALKFIWAPWVDRVGAGQPNHRKRWIIGCQAAAAMVVLGVALIDPATLFSTHLFILIGLLGLLNLCCATQDIAADGLAVRLLTARLRGPGNSIQVAGYKLGMMLGGGALLIWVGLLGWTTTFLLVALLLLLMLWPVSRFPEPATQQDPASRQRLDFRAWRREITRFWGRPGMLWWLLLLLGYKVGDSFGSRMLKPFLVDSGWTLPQIGVLDLSVSVAGLLAAVVGGLLMMRLARPVALTVFGLLHALAFAGWAWLAAGEASTGQIWALAMAEQCADAMATVALFTVMMDQCRAWHEGADYTLQASMQLMAVGLFALASGFSAEWLGFSGHFLFSALLCLAAIMAIPLWWRSQQARR
ncbi:MFS transporter [Alcanivorax sp. JB21]|uniref:MFS transporter n=1 Tax=Alcanivorax limicola TaxID=2874102 RepID=UPI001CBB4BC0|nr:MFS transporter [Alcanivorax limicola]MBZ2187507.1 MFS transporter [Alcanivorax limicola]